MVADQVPPRRWNQGRELAQQLRGLQHQLGPAIEEAAARELGAELFIPTKTAAAAEALQAWEGGADLILATAPSVESASSAFAGLAPNGMLVLLGVGPGELVSEPDGTHHGKTASDGLPSGVAQGAP